MIKLNFNGGQLYKNIFDDFYNQWPIKRNTRKSIITTLINEQWESDDQENKIKTTLIINYLFYLHNNWYVEVKCQIGWMDGKAGLQQSKNFVTELMGEWMDGWNKIKL